MKYEGIPAALRLWTAHFKTNFGKRKTDGTEVVFLPTPPISGGQWRLDIELAKGMQPSTTQLHLVLTPRKGLW